MYGEQRANLPVLGPQTAVEVAQGGGGLDGGSSRGLETGGGGGGGNGERGLAAESGGETDGGGNHCETKMVLGLEMMELAGVEDSCWARVEVCTSKVDGEVLLHATTASVYMLHGQSSQ